MEKKRILAIPALGYAHVTRLIELVSALQRDFDVLTVVTQPFKELTDNLGLESLVLNHSGIDYNKIAKGNVNVFTVEEMSQMAHDYVDVLMQNRPDFVVTSGVVPAHIAIRHLGLPHVSVLDTSTTPYANHKIQISQEFVLKGKMFQSGASEQEVYGLLSKMSLEERRKQVATVDELAKPIIDTFNNVTQQFRVRQATNIIDMLQGDLNLMPDLPSIFPASNLPDNFVYIGPLAWNSTSEVLETEIRIDRGKPLVYVSMGSSGNQRDLQKLAELLSKSEYQVVMTVGGVANSDDLKKYERQGFYVRKFLPGSKVIKSSDKTIVICHGGLGTVYQALENGAHGIMVIPAHPQHDLVGDRLEELGLGKTVRFDELDKIVESTARFLSLPKSPAYEKLNTELRDYRGPVRGREVILSFAERL